MSSSISMNGIFDMSSHLSTLGALLAEESFFHRLFFFSRGATAEASKTDDLYMWLWWFCVIWFVFLMVLMTYFVVKYRRRKGKIAPFSSSHNTALEVAWTVIPTLMLVYIFFVGFKGYMGKMVAPGHAIELNVVGQQWSWSVVYPNGAETTTVKLIGAKPSPVFYVPGDVPVRLRMNSTDVMHAFWVPDFRVKADVLPNRYTTLWFQAPAPKGEKGQKIEYHPKTEIEAKAQGVEFIPEIAGSAYIDHIIYCAEYCGDEHSEMAGVIRVVAKDDYNKWLAYIEDPKGKPLIEVGEFIWKTKCASCHTIDGTAGTGPTWKDLYGNPVEFTDGTSIPAADDNYIRDSILYPTQKLHKGYGPNMALIALKERQIMAVISFIKKQSSHPSAQTPTFDPSNPTPEVPVN